MPAAFFDEHANPEQLQPAGSLIPRAESIALIGDFGRDEASHKNGWRVDSKSTRRWNYRRVDGDACAVNSCSAAEESSFFSMRDKIMAARSTWPRA